MPYASEKINIHLTSHVLGRAWPRTLAHTGNAATVFHRPVPQLYSPINEQPPHTAQGAWLPACKRRNLRLRPQHQRDRPLKDDDHRRVQLARRHSAHKQELASKFAVRQGTTAYMLARAWAMGAASREAPNDMPSCRGPFGAWLCLDAAPIPIPTVSTGGARQRVGRGLQPYLSRGSPRACLYCSTKKPAASSSSSV